MALQTGQNQVKINGVEIQVFSSEKGIGGLPWFRTVVGYQRAIRSRLLPCWNP